MATIKSYANIEQSHKLAEILPLESADMKILPFTEREYRVVPINDISVCDRDDEIPCWSLSALFGVLPTIDDEFEPQLHRSLDKYFCTYEGEEDSSGLWRVADNPIDACYEMILKLHELNLL